MKKIIISSAIIVAAVLFYTSVMYSQPQGNDQCPMRKHLNDCTMDGKGFGQICEKLNLTTEQQAKINDLRVNHQKKMIDLRADLQKARLDANEVRKSENLSRSDVVKSVEKVNKIENEMAILKANHRMDIYELLTPDQKKLWKEFRDDKPMHKMWKDMKHERD